MKKLVLAVVFATLAAPLMAAVTTWEKAPLIDKMCLAKKQADPDSHPRSCLIQCAKSGYGLLAGDGIWLRFDNAGNQKALAALKASDKKDHIRVTVTGEQVGDMIKVQSLEIQ
jgi:hypothetical protein